MANGTVKWFNTTKGFGFIEPASGGKDVFVHISAVERAGMTGLRDNQAVAYELQEGRDGRSSAGCSTSSMSRRCRSDPDRGRRACPSEGSFEAARPMADRRAGRRLCAET